MDTIRHLALLLLLIGLAPAGRADILRLVNGSRLTGTIKTIHQGKVQFETGFAGVLTIDLGQVAGLSTQTPVQVQLQGQTAPLQGMLEDQDGRLVVRDRAMGPVPVALDRLAALWQPGQASPLTQVAEAQAPAPAVAPDRWSGRLRFGFSGATGNADRVALTGRLDGKRETERSRLSGFVEANYAQEDGSETQNEIFVGAAYERDIYDRWFAFCDINLERDELEDLDLRAIASAGAGSFAIQQPDQEWKLELGAGYRQEFFQDGSSDEEAIATLGYDYFIVLNAYVRFSHEFTYLPTLADPLGDFRLLSNAQIDLPVDDSNRWTLSLGIRNQFDSAPQPGNADLDTVYALTLNYSY